MRHSLCVVLEGKEPLCLCSQHELLLKLAPVLERGVHPRDCCARAGRRPLSHSEPQQDVFPANGAPYGDTVPAHVGGGGGGHSSSTRALPISRSASLASHDNLQGIDDQVLSIPPLGPPGTTGSFSCLADRQSCCACRAAAAAVPSAAGRR